VPEEDGEEGGGNSEVTQDGSEIKRSTEGSSRGREQGRVGIGVHIVMDDSTLLLRMIESPNHATQSTYPECILCVEK